MLVEKLLGWYDEEIVYHAIYTNIFEVVAISVYGFALSDKKPNLYQGSDDREQRVLAGIIITF
jgi:hypothetical protein